MPRETGFARADVADDFQRLRRQQVLSRLARRLTREPDDVAMILPFDEVVAALGLRSQRFLGQQTIRLDSIVGTVDSRRDFDRRFRPTTERVRGRWEQLALAQRAGAPIPPIDVFRVGGMHFVADGHHRTSIALAAGRTTIDALVTEVETTLPAGGIERRSDLLHKDYQRVFAARVPLPPDELATIEVGDPWAYAELGEGVEAWGCRLMQVTGQFADRAEIARRWYAEEYRPVVAMIEQADLRGDRTQAEAYMRVARERYRLMRTHEWNDEVVARLTAELR